MNLTPHFTLEEFEYSATAEKHHIDNSIPEQYIPNIKRLCEEVLEPLREYAGIPIIISSGYRCPELNRLVGGIQNSQHLKGEAVDIRINNINEGRLWFKWLSNCTQYDQLIWESKGATHWIHISLCLDDSKNRQHAFRICK